MADPLPHDLEAERAVLAAPMFDPATVDELAALVAPEQFYHPAHALVWTAVLALHDRREPIDVVTLANELRTDGRLATIGGAQFLGALTDGTATTAHVERHARIVAELADVRAMVAGMREAIALACSGGKRDVVADRVQRLALKAGERRGESQPRRIDDLLERVFARLEQRATGTPAPGLRTGFEALDRLLNPMRGGQVIVIAGRPSMGKTSLVNKIAVNVASGSRKIAASPALFFSLETKEDDLADRTAAMEASIDVATIQRTAPNAEEMRRLVSAATRLHPIPLWFDDGYELSIATMRRKAKRHAQKHGLGLVIVDYLGLMKASRTLGRVDEVSEITRGLKALAKELDVPIIALSQLNRGPEGRTVKDHRPRMSDLRDSGSVEQDADAVIFVYRDEVYDHNTSERGIAELIVAKQKNGPTGTAKVKFVHHATRFEDLPDERASATNNWHDTERDDDAMLPESA